MKILFNLMVLATVVAFTACGGEDKVKIAKEFESLPTEYAQYCSEWKSEIEKLDLAIKDYELDKDERAFKKLAELCPDFVFSKDYSDLSEENKIICKKVEYSVDSTRKALERYLDSEIRDMHFSVIDREDFLFEKDDEFYDYFYKGSKIYFDIKIDGKMTVKVYNADSKSYIKTYTNQSHILDSLELKNSAIYLIEFSPKGNVYSDVKVDINYAKIEHLLNKKDVEREMVECQANEQRVIKIDGIQMKNLFEEPRKFTLRSQGKSIFSGSSRATIPINIPAGTTDLLYSLRISTNEGTQSSDGEFNRNLHDVYKEVKFAGKTVYEKTEKKSSILRDLLYGTEPAREEEAYCNVFVFTNSGQAKKFQDNTPTPDLKYDIDLSLMGTQSTNGKIPCKGMRNIYFGFENERFRFSNYLWLEVVAVSPKTEYHKYVYRIKE